MEVLVSVNLKDIVSNGSNENGHKVSGNLELLQY